MSKVIDGIISKAQSLGKTIVLPEGDEKRTVKAAEIITSKKIAKIILLANEEAVKAKYPEINFSGIEFIDPAAVNVDEYASIFCELRKGKKDEMTLDEAKVAVPDADLILFLDLI